MVSFSAFWLAVVEVGDYENDSSLGGWLVELHNGGLMYVYLSALAAQTM